MWPSGDNGGLVIWKPFDVGGSNPTVDKIFCNVHLFRVPRSWAGSVQMKSSMTFNRGKRFIERENDTFKSCEFKRLKECALALNTVRGQFPVYGYHAGHTRKASRISKTVVENCGKGVGNF